VVVAFPLDSELYQSINQKHISIAPYVASESEAHDDGNYRPSVQSL